MTEYIVKVENLAKLRKLAGLHVKETIDLTSGKIVRCRDCKHFTPVDKEHGNNDWCAKHEHIAWSVNGFCAWASRKEDNDGR